MRFVYIFLMVAGLSSTAAAAPLDVLEIKFKLRLDRIMYLIEDDGTPSGAANGTWHTARSPQHRTPYAAVPGAVVDETILVYRRGHEIYAECQYVLACKGAYHGPLAMPVHVDLTDHVRVSTQFDLIRGEIYEDWDGGPQMIGGGSYTGALFKRSFSQWSISDVTMSRVAAQVPLSNSLPLLVGSLGFIACLARRKSRRT
ncbi:MAG: hypothetical protein AAF340_00640 [Pseudomonadota bacterium]